MTHLAKCTVCEKDFFESFVAEVKGTDLELYNLYKCSNCGFIGVFPVPDDAYINRYYTANHPGRIKTKVSTFNAIKTNKAAIEDCYRKLRYIENRCNLDGNKILDVGSGTGFFLYAAKNKNYEPLGVDIDKGPIAFGKEHFQVDAINRDINSFDQLESKYSNTFDVVTFWMVLEHLRYPYETILSVTKLIKKGGYLAGSVPNADGVGVKIKGLKKWYLTIPPEHLNYFNKQSLRHLFLRVGLKPVFIGTVPLYAMPYIVFGIRKSVIRWAQDSENKLMKTILLLVHRILTLTKRYLFFFPLNHLIMLLGVEGNSLLFIAQKEN